jgi:anti-sigma factor RsiW
VEAISHVARCQECIDLLVDYLEGELSPERTRALEIHFDLCPACWQFVQSYRQTIDAARRLPAEDIPPELAQRLIAFLNQERRDSGARP